MIQIKFGKTTEPIDPESFRHCQFCIEMQEPMGEHYDGPYPDEEEVSNLQKIVICFFQIFQKSIKIISTFFR